MSKQKIITVESVMQGHPDKVCDQISDAILDAYLMQDPKARVAIECLGTYGLLVIAGEVSSNAQVDYKKIARETYRNIGYTDKVKIIERVSQQSPEISSGVDVGGAGDQGIMYGYATSETTSMLPKPVEQVQRMMKMLTDLSQSSKKYFGLGPDGKGQLTYRDGRLQTILISVQHEVGWSLCELFQLIKQDFLPRVFDDLSGVEVLINPTGKFTVGGFTADTGLTGRKIMVDTYCGLVPHGGGAFSGKDASKVDRSGAYYARYVAKNIVAQGLAKKALVSVAYAIGKADPLMVDVQTCGTGNVSNALEFVKKNFDFRPQNMIEELELHRPIFQKTASFGHFGYPDYSWERIKLL